MTKAIIFDWGGVLIDNPSVKLREYCAGILDVDTKKYLNAIAPYKKDFQKGDVTEIELWHNVCDDLGIDEPRTKSLWGDAVEEVFNEKEEMFDLINKLKEQGYKIGFLSNTEMPAVEYWKKNDYAKYFDEAVFSCVEHIAKPDAEIYELICERLEILPQDAVFIDDKPGFVSGAKNIGMEGIVFENIVQLNKDLSVYYN